MQAEFVSVFSGYSKIKLKTLECSVLKCEEISINVKHSLLLQNRYSGENRIGGGRVHSMVTTDSGRFKGRKE